jgi:hypothetical protein
VELAVGLRGYQELLVSEKDLASLAGNSGVDVLPTQSSFTAQKATTFGLGPDRAVCLPTEPISPVDQRGLQHGLPAHLVTPFAFSSWRRSKCPWVSVRTLCTQSLSSRMRSSPFQRSPIRRLRLSTPHPPDPAQEIRACGPCDTPFFTNKRYLRRPEIFF